MNNFARKAAVSLFAGAALTIGGLSPAAMAAPVVTGGLVNVTVVDLVDLTNTSVTVPVTVAAQICGVSVQALVVDLGPNGTVTDCDQAANTITTVTQRTVTPRTR